MSNVASHRLLLAAVLLGAVGATAAAPWSITFSGAQPQQQGLVAVSAPEVGHRVVSAAGRTCWSTDAAAGALRIAVQAPALPERRGPSPVAVTVLWLDRGRGQWALEYDAVDLTGAVHRQCGPVLSKSGSEAWRETTFALRDAALSSPPTGWWLAVRSFGEMAGEDEEFVAALAVQPGGLALVAPEPGVVPAGRPVELGVLAQDAEGQPLAGVEKVSLQAAGGQLPAEVTLMGGRAVFTWQPPERPGPARLSASAGGGRSDALSLLVLPGTGPLQREALLVDPCVRPDDWLQWPVQASASLLAVGGGEDEEPALALAYGFTGRTGRGYVDLAHRALLRGVPEELQVEVRGEGGATRLQAFLEDATGQLFCYDLGRLRWPQWADLRFPLRGYTWHSGGAGDGEFHLPVSFLRLRVMEGAPGSAAAGRFVWRNVIARSLAP